MPEHVATLNFILASGGIALLFAAFVLAFDYLTNRTLQPLIARYGILLAFLATLAGSILTLIYSEIFGFVPCGLCWLQRVFLYPQVFLLGVAIAIKDRQVALYGLVLTIPGIVVSLYQHYLQMGGPEVVGCPTAGGDCAKRILFEFGFMTFPLLSATLFVFLAVLYFYIFRTS